MACLIEYQGRQVEVTPDTAAELVDRGEAVLVSGVLGDLPRPAASSEPAPAPPPTAAAPPTTPTARPRKRRG